MGCNGSKSADVKDGRPAFLTVDAAVEELQQQLDCSKHNALMLVGKANKNHTGKIANKELVALWTDIKSKKDELKPKFEMYDADGSGSVSESEALNVVKRKFPGASETQLKRMIRRYMTDGQMHYNDFVYFYIMVKTRKEALQSRFVELDKDGNGVLSPEEVVQAIKDECAVDDMLARCLVEDFDVNSDGELNRDEFTAMFIKLFEDQEAAVAAAEAEE